MNENESSNKKVNPLNFYSTDGGENFGIAFDKIFDNDQLEVYNLFEMSSKRNFKNLTNSIVKTYQELFLKKTVLNEDLAIILFNILNCKSKLMVNENTPYTDFIEQLDSILQSADSLLLTTIDKHVEANYALNLDKITEDTKKRKNKVNVELQFVDRHAKILIKIAYLYRILIPLISVYFTYNKQSFAKTEQEALDTENKLEDYQFDEINANIFSFLFDKIAKKSSKALKNKLFKLTFSRVAKTAYSDKRFWSMAKTHGITKETVSAEIYKKLLTNSIPKLVLDKDRNIISFFQSVIMNQIDFLFQNKFKHRHSSLGSSNQKYSDDDDDETEFEKVEIELTRKDEGIFVIRRETIKNILRDLPGVLGIEVTDLEVKEEMKRLKKHNIQEQIVALATFKYFEDKNSIKLLNYMQYTKLVLIVKKYLLLHKYKYLPAILTANCEKHKERTQISGKKVRPLIQNSKKYNELLGTKYRNFETEIEKPLIMLISSTYSSVFKDDEGKELFDSTVKVEKIANELIDLAYLV